MQPEPVQQDAMQALLLDQRRPDAQGREALNGFVVVKLRPDETQEFESNIKKVFN